MCLTVVLLLEFISGLASDGIRHSVVCLSSEHLSLQPTVLALIISLSITPCAMYLFWIVFWAAFAATCKHDRPPRYLLKRCMLSLMVLWYITLVPALRTALSAFLCVEVHDSAVFKDVDVTHKYWAVDTALKCHEGDHSTLLYVVSLVCVVYGILFVFFIICLRISVQHLTHKASWVYQTMGFLYRCYKLDRRRYWEIAVVLEKAIIAFLVFCASLFDSVLPITGIAHFITLAIVMQILAMPYRERFQDLNKTRLASLFVSLATTQSAIMLSNEDYPEDYIRELLTVACLLLNLMTFLVFVFLILKFAAEYLKHILTERDENDAADAGVFSTLVLWIGYEFRHLIGKLRSAPESHETVRYSDADV